MIEKAIAAQRWWSEQPEVECPKLTKDPESSRANSIGDRYAKALAMIEPWAKRTPRTWAEIASAAETYLGHEPSRQTVLRWASRRNIVVRHMRARV
jgi:hypothetical protein